MGTKPSRAADATSSAMCRHVSLICGRKRACSSPAEVASATAVPTLPWSTYSYPSSTMRASSPAYRIADGPMSTPRRPAPRSSAAPMTATFRDGCRDMANKANFPPDGESEAASMIRVLLADDDGPFLEALSPLIERQPQLAVVGTAGDGL